MTLPPRYFDDVYAKSPDPWGFRDRWYEQRKRAVTLALLPRQRFRSAYEPGCSIGVLTGELATRCDDVLATDVAKAAVAEARGHVANLPNVRIEQACLPDDWPSENFELVVLSEVGYYFSAGNMRDVASRACASAEVLLAVHWRHRVSDYPLLGDEVHAILTDESQKAGMHRLAQLIDADFVADLWSNDNRSVAARAGLA